MRSSLITNDRSTASQSCRRRRIIRVECFRFSGSLARQSLGPAAMFNSQLSTTNSVKVRGSNGALRSQPSTALYERQIKREANVAVMISALAERIAENIVALTHWPQGPVDDRSSCS